MAYGRYGVPALKSTVDLQLQTAFNDANWNTVIRLADKRFRSLKDPYYEVRHAPRPPKSIPVHIRHTCPLTHPKPPC